MRLFVLAMLFFFHDLYGVTTMANTHSSKPLINKTAVNAQPSPKQMKMAFNVLLGLILLMAALIFMVILVNLPGAF
jgi:hypothetical protein